MNSCIFTQEDCKKETTSNWLIAVMEFGLKINIFKHFENFKPKMKEVKYSVYQKLIITIIMSIIMSRWIKMYTYKNFRDSKFYSTYVFYG
ncbi:MAG: hypothetical protein E7211_13440 [Clostridium lundense]|nr:hypothetical protein [Clostridium lundense]